MSPRLIHAAWARVSRLQARPFHRAIRNLAGAQERHLLGVLGAHAHTRIGRRYEFSSIRSVESYQRRVPLAEYEDYLPDIERIRDGEPRVLTADPVLRFEPTSGTRAHPKLVPYTRGLRREVTRAVAPWIADLFATHPALKGGAMYWAISPRIEVGNHGVIPVGFDSDTGYFGGIAARLASRVLPVPAALGAIQNLDTFRYLTLLFLLAREDLRLVSVWNPTFLELLLAPVADWHTDLVRDLFDGTVSRGNGWPGVRADARRARRVEAALDHGQPDWEAVWPELTVISCWADGWASEAIPRVQALFPGAVLQPKGLLSTEAMVTIPLGPSARPVLAAASHFYEFLDPVSGDVRLAHELRDGTCYEVVVTTAGGLYRYRLHDRVTPEGLHFQAPVLRFLGRDERVSDLRGEKLHESFVAQVLADLHARDACLRPHCTGRRARYDLVMSRPAPDPDRLIRQLDRRLRQNVHYDYCRRLGQLDAPRIRVLESPATSPGPLSTSKPPTALRV